MPDQDTQARLFVSYSHDDAGTVLADAAWLGAQGFAAWIDSGIRPGSDWAGALTQEIDRCAALLFFASHRSIASAHCLNEIAYAVDAGKPIVVVYLEPVELSGGIKLFVSRTQAILRWQLSTDEARHQILDVLNGHARNPAQAKSKPPAVWHVPLRRNHSFSGREQLLAAIEETLGDTPDPAVLVLAGLAGVGKSQIALEFAFRQAGEFSVVAWLRAEESATLNADFVDLAHGLGIERANDTDRAIVIEAVKRWLAGNANWLMIFDNVEDPQLAAAYLPNQFRGKVIMTTRRQNWGNWVRRLSIDEFTQQQAEEFLLARTRETDRKAAAGLARALGCLPLALEEAAAYVEATGRTIASYLSLFNEHHELLLAQGSPQGSSTGDYPGSLRAAFEVSLQQLRVEDPLAGGLLEMFAFVAPDDIPHTLWETALQRSGEAAGPLLVDRCLSALRKFSLVNIHGDAIAVHRLVQLVIRDRMSAPDRERIATDVLRQVESVFPHIRDMGTAAAASVRLLPHAVAALGHARAIPAVAATACSLWGRTGSLLSARNASDEGAAHLERAYTLSKSHPDQHRLFARTCELFGRILYYNGELDRSRAIYGEALAAYQLTDGNNAPRLMPIYVDLAWIEWRAGDFDAAERASRRALEVLGSATGTPDPRATAALSILARTLLEQGRIDDCRRTIDATIAAIDALDDTHNPLMCASLLLVAQVLQGLGVPLQAKSWAERAIEIGTPTFSPHHALLSASRCVLGQALITLGEPESAKPHLAAATESIRATRHPLSQYICVAPCVLVGVLTSVGEIDAARSLANEADGVLDQRISGDGVIARALGAVMHAKLAVIDSDPGRAQLLLSDADASITRFYGAEHPHRMPLLHVLAELQLQQGRIEAATATHEIGLGIGRRHDLTLHPHVADHLVALADIASRLGEDQRAASLRGEAIEIYRQRIGPSSRAVRAFG